MCFHTYEMAFGVFDVESTGTDYAFFVAHFCVIDLLGIELVNCWRFGRKCGGLERVLYGGLRGWKLLPVVLVGGTSGNCKLRSFADVVTLSKGLLVRTRFVYLLQSRLPSRILVTLLEY